MLSKFFGPITHPEIEALQLSSQLKSFLYDIIKHGQKGASTFDLQSEQHGNISTKTKAVQEKGVLISTSYRDVIDKRGNLRRQVAHRTFHGIKTNRDD